jgi:hypothetical protein
MSETATSTPRMRLARVTPFPVETDAAGVQRERSTESRTQDLVQETSGATALKPVIPIDRLYEAPEGTTSNVVRALQLLTNIADNLTQAKNCESPMEADRYVQRVQADLPKLFACRSIGDGFGAIVNSLHFAFINLGGSPLSREQLNVMWRVLRELRERPIMTLDQGISSIEELEATGLVVDPADLDALIGDRESATDV